MNKKIQMDKRRQINQRKQKIMRILGMYYKQKTEVTKDTDDNVDTDYRGDIWDTKDTNNTECTDYREQILSSKIQVALFHSNVNVPLSSKIFFWSFFPV